MTWDEIVISLCIGVAIWSAGDLGWFLLKRHRQRVRLANTRWTMTDEERQAQRISFVYENCRISNEHVTREMVEDAARKIDAEKLRAKGETP